MNALKVFVIVIGMFFSAAASAVTVSVISAESVGRSDAYWAGIVMLDVDGQKMIGMFDTQASPDRWALPFPASWEANLYTQADILAGAQVNFSPQKYSEVAPFFINGLLGYNPPDELWAASFNEMVWNTMIPPMAIPQWYYANLPYGESTLTDVYNSMLPGLDQNYDYSNSMKVLANAYDPVTGTWPDREMLVYAVPMASTPVPPALWLFGSGLLGLAGIARRKVFRT